MKNKLCFATTIGAMPILLRQQAKNKFSVQYFKQLRTDLNYSEAGKELGYAIMHASACEGTLDNRMPGER